MACEDAPDTCIPLHQLCDGKEHCPGGTDEGGRYFISIDDVVQYALLFVSYRNRVLLDAHEIFAQPIVLVAPLSVTTARMDHCAVVHLASRYYH